MMTRQLFAALTATLVLSAASAAFADAPTVSAEASTRVQRRFSLAATNTLPLGLVGVNAQYHLSDRVALGAQASVGLTFIPAATAGLGMRVFLNAEPRSGLFFDASAQALASIGTRGLGGAAELGYQYRARSGFLFEVSAQVLVLHISEPDYHHVRTPEPSPWRGIPGLNLRFGYAF